METLTDWDVLELEALLVIVENVLSMDADEVCDEICVDVCDGERVEDETLDAADVIVEAAVKFVGCEPVRGEVDEVVVILVEDEDNGDIPFVDNVEVDAEEMIEIESVDSDGNGETGGLDELAPDEELVRVGLLVEIETTTEELCPVTGNRYMTPSQSP